MSGTFARPGDKLYAVDKDIGQYTLLNAERRDGQAGSNHWQLGDRKGSFLWDPLSGKDSGGRKEFVGNRRHVTISRECPT